MWFHESNHDIITSHIPYKVTAFHEWEKVKPVCDSAVCYRTFQSPTNRDVPRTEKRVTTNQISNVPTNDRSIIIQLQDCNIPGKNKAEVQLASQPFSPSLSKRFFNLPLPSVKISSINRYPNGTPVNNRGQALIMWGRLKLVLK